MISSWLKNKSSSARFLITIWHAVIQVPKDYETAIVVYSKFINELNSKFRHGPRPLDPAEIEHRMRKGDNIPIEEINEGHANHLFGFCYKTTRLRIRTLREIQGSRF